LQKSKKKRRSKSSKNLKKNLFCFFQQWNSLSRFQKNLVVLLIFGGILLGGFLVLQGQKPAIPDSSILIHVDENNRIDDNRDDKKIQIMPIKVSILECLLLSCVSFICIYCHFSVHTQTLHLHHFPNTSYLSVDQDDDTSSIHMQNNNNNQLEANDGEWAEFENFQHPLDSQQPADIEMKLPSDKKEVANQLPQVETQMSFKVEFFELIFLSFIKKLYLFVEFYLILLPSLNFIAILGSNE
jgi:hypothetical protein